MRVFVRRGEESICAIEKADWDQQAGMCFIELCIMRALFNYEYDQGYCMTIKQQKSLKAITVCVTLLHMLDDNWTLPVLPTW